MLRQWFQDALWEDQFGSAEVGEKTRLCWVQALLHVPLLQDHPGFVSNASNLWRGAEGISYPCQGGASRQAMLGDMEGNASRNVLSWYGGEGFNYFYSLCRVGDCSTWPPTIHQFCAAVRSVPRRGPIIGSWLRMTERPACVEEWFDRLPQLLSPQGWEIASDRHGTLSHCPCPWGGRLIKITLDGLLPCWRVRCEFFLCIISVFLYYRAVI